ncbi:MAG: hypothetical protein GY927_03875 [bacterium]|nr:hypothetical protein [bacterium]
MAQNPPPNPLHAPTQIVDFSGKLHNSDGTPWIFSATAKVSYEHNPIDTVVEFQCDYEGSYFFRVQVPTEVIDKGGVIYTTIWAHPESAPIDGENQFFLDPALGLAAFGKAIQVQNDGSSNPTVNEDFTLSTPPLYGTLAVGNPSSQLVSVSVVDFASFPDLALERARALSAATPRVRKTIPIQGGVLPIYRWSNAGASHVFFFGPNGSVVNELFIRRGSTLPVTVKKEEKVTITVDCSAISGCYAVYIVSPNLHQPDPSVPDKSSRSVWAQSRDATHQTTIDRGAQSFAQDFWVPDSDYVVELWIKTETPAAFVFSLERSAVVLASDTNPSVLFN